MDICMGSVLTQHNQSHYNHSLCTCNQTDVHIQCWMCKYSTRTIINIPSTGMCFGERYKIPFALVKTENTITTQHNTILVHTILYSLELRCEHPLHMLSYSHLLFFMCTHQSGSRRLFSFFKKGSNGIVILCKASR